MSTTATASAERNDTFQCDRYSSEKISHDFYRVILSIDDKDKTYIDGGQYLYITMSNGDCLPYSIANYVGYSEKVELNIRLTKSSRHYSELKQRLDTPSSLNVSLPFGKCTLPHNQRELLFLAWGTGFSQTKALLECANHRMWQKNITIFRIAASEDDVYDEDVPYQQFGIYDLIKVKNIISTPDRDHPERRIECLKSVIQSTFDNLKDIDVFASGSKNDVNSIKHWLKDSDLYPNSFNSDMS